MKLGFSIENPALKKNNDKDILLANFNNLEKFLNYLKECGIKSIEIRKLTRYADIEEYKEAIQLIWDTGMEITIHGEITGNLSYNNFLEVYPSLEYILENFEKYQRNLIMPIHAYQSSEKRNREELRKKTIEELGRWSELIEQENIPLYIALENNREKKQIVDPGNQTNDVIDMVNKVNNSHVGICWDMGHYYSNLLNDKNLTSLPENIIYQLPSDLFLDKVYHTHIHGLNQNCKTHFPLTKEKSLPLEYYLTSLENRGYNSVCNLELSLTRWGSQVSLTDEIDSTVKRLKKMNSFS